MLTLRKPLIAALTGAAIIPLTLAVVPAADAATPYHVVLDSGPELLKAWHPYTATKSNNPALVTSRSGYLNIHLTAGKATAPAVAGVAGVGGWFISNKATSGDVKVTIQVVGGKGWGVANSVWPSSNDWRGGEKNWPEGRIQSPPAAHDHATGDRCGRPPAKLNCVTDATFFSRATWAHSHVYETRWNGSGTSYLLDGRMLGSVHKWPVYGTHRVDTFQVGPKDSTVAVGDIRISRIDAVYTEGG